MKILIHQNAKTFVKVISPGDEEVLLTSKTCTEAFWELAEKFPNEVIGWCEERLQGEIAIERWKVIFHHNLIMASYALKTTFLPPSIGYVDLMPFINIARGVSYGTWIMSSDVGGIKGAVLLRFRTLFQEEKDFNYLLNSVSKVGQQNGLFCYSELELLNFTVEPLLESQATKTQLFRFVHQHYSTAWTSILLLCFIIFERSFPFPAYLRSLFNSKHFKKVVDLSEERIASKRRNSAAETIDVIIPTIGRAKYLYDVLKDFSVQTHFPEKIIIVEQNSDPGSVSELNYLQEEVWPFKIVHCFIHRTGACNARNIALEGVTSEFVFFADDDIRLGVNLLKNILLEIEKNNFCAVNMNCRQPGEEIIFGKVKQWASFGSGTSVVKSDYAKKCRFSNVFEHGHGEDADFGMQLRRAGCDIVYHPHLEIKHLKAPIGGFRQKPNLQWEREDPLPKPSPTVMAYALRNYTPQQLNGYRVSLYVKYYTRQKIKNPISYISTMNKRWEKSMVWADKLMKEGQSL